MTQRKWLHGTEVCFTQWKVGLPPQAHKNGMPSHAAIFFTTSVQYASDCANNSGNIYTTAVLKDARVLDMALCMESESEKFRDAARKQRVTQDNAQLISAQAWREGWATGQIMKYMPSTLKEFEALNAKVNLALNYRHTPAGVAAFNELQKLTRDNIEGLVSAARSLEYDGIIGNEIDTVSKPYPKTFEIMFITNPSVLTAPSAVQIMCNPVN